MYDMDNIFPIPRQNYRL